MEIRIAAENAMKLPMKNQSARAGEDPLRLGHSPSGNAEPKSNEREAGEAEEVQIRRAARPANCSSYVEEF